MDLSWYTVTLVQVIQLFPGWLTDWLFQEAINDYFADRKNPKDRAGHFVRRYEDIKSYVVSASVDSVRKVAPKKGFMT